VRARIRGSRPSGSRFILAPIVALEALRQLIAGDEPSASWLGIALATTSLIGMPLLGIAKRRLAYQLGSASTRGEGTRLTPA
jgi:divalent metal cation (Fe/Co/Zn/Cd) transporter